MAGEWIKMRVDLLTSPKVVRISSALKADRLRVVGGLHSVWCLFDVHSEDGTLTGYTPEVVDDLIGWPGFSGAMIAVGWLEKNDDSLSIPRFDQHNGQSAKRRAQDSHRKRTNRGQMSASQADKMRTREEKRREEVNLKALSGKPSAVPDAFPPESEKPKNGNHYNPLARDVLVFLNAKTGRNYQPVDANLKLIVARLKEGASVSDCRAVVAKKCREWVADEKMSGYLRPATLFNATKFAQYRGELVEMAGDDSVS